jgi:hypothetical protein
MNVTVVSDLVSEPLSLTEAKKWMRIEEFTSDDTLITDLIKGTRNHLEKFTGLSFGSKTLRTTMTIKAMEWVEIPYGPVNTITLVEKYDESDNAFSAYTDYVNFESKIKLYEEGIFRITYTAGFSSLPEDLKTDLKVLVAWQYKNRGIDFGASATETIKEYPHWNLLNSRHYRKVVI